MVGGSALAGADLLAAAGQDPEALLNVHLLHGEVARALKRAAQRARDAQVASHQWCKNVLNITTYALVLKYFSN